MLACLSDACLSALAALCAKCEEVGVAGNDVVGIVVVFLPKPAGGVRPISTTSAFQAIYEQARLRHARAWIAANDHARFCAGLARGAEDIAWEVALRAEAASQAAVATMVIDL